MASKLAPTAEKTGIEKEPGLTEPNLGQASSDSNAQAADSGQAPAPPPVPSVQFAAASSIALAGKPARATGKRPPATSAPHVAVTITSARMLGFESSTSAPKVPSRRPEPRNERVEAVVRDMDAKALGELLCAVARLADRHRV